METVYPDQNEMEFRNANYSDIEDILKSKVECVICNNDLLTEIISKKMIMVHRSHLFLCCYNCFYKLCEGNEFSCILCQSNHTLSNCEKCNRNICKHCLKNHKIDQASDGVLSKCFGCDSQMLWKQRAQAANVLKIFNSQLDMPNGLLVNEIEREQTVRKYLLELAKSGQNSKTDTIKNRLCINFLLNSYKSTIFNKLSEFSPIIDDNTSTEACSNNFIEVCEHILEKTSSTLSNFKRILNLNTNLSPGVSAIMKSLLKSTDEDEHKFNCSKLNENSRKIVTNNNVSLNTTNLISDSTNNMVNSVSNSLLSTDSSQPSFNPNNRELVVVLERIKNPLFPETINNKSNMTHSDVEMDNLEHTLDIFDDISSDEEIISPRKLRSRNLKPVDKKEVKKESKKSKNTKEILKTLTEDEKENNRLINLSNLNISKKKVISDEDHNKSDSSSGLPMDVDDDSCSENKTSTNKVDKKEIMENTINDVDEVDSDIEDDCQNDDFLLKPVKDMFLEVRNAMGIPSIISEPISDDSDSTSLSDVIDSCFNACNRRGIDHYLKKSQELLSNIIDNNTDSEELDNEENLELTDEESDVQIRTRSKKLMQMPSINDDSGSSFDANEAKKDHSSSNDSDSSSKYFKRKPMTRSRKNVDKSSSSVSLSSNSYSSSNDSSDENTSPIVKKRRKCAPLKSSDESDNASGDNSESSNVKTNKTKGRKNIRKLKKKTELSQLTIDAIKEEQSRKKRIEDRQKRYNEIFDLPKPTETYKKLVLDFDPETKEELISVHPDIVKFLKPHQVEGIKFLWTSVFESLSQIKNSKGNGSIVAHCMGLGKTLQVIALVHTLFWYPETDIQTVLIITPNSTIENWCNEFHKWLKNISEENNFNVFNFNDTKTYGSRKLLIDKWHEEHGVLITSYDMYRTVLSHKGLNKFPTILEGLVDPGPDLVVCDEGHLLKNHKSTISKIMSKIKTLRRIVLTGTPLQNNLKEYHCMVDFIRPNLLGSIKEFTNRFINPINNGQYSDSTPYDVKLMKRRSHVLHKMLEGFVQRFDYSVLTPFLPPKQEYVIYLKMADKQIELYRHYLSNLKQPGIFNNYYILQKIWTHPKLLALYALRRKNAREKQKLKSMDEVLIDDDTSYSDSNSNGVTGNDDPSVERTTANNPEVTRAMTPELDLYWWKSLTSKKDLEGVYPYSKFLMMFSILKECEDIGDKVLIFSHSLNTLDIIQEFLEDAEDLDSDEGGPYGKSWTQGQDFFRIDGSVSVKVREECCMKFNDITNTKMRLLLLSTKAFNLGVNLVGANRVIIFDVTWNPSLNVQSIFRVFRFGQNKPSYIYRFISEGTMEQKIYERQISKLSLSFRVVDEHQIDRHFNAKDQEVLYEFEPNTSKPKTFNLPKDRLMAEVVLKHKDLVMDILEHDSLLQNNEAEELDEDDRKAAWEDYERERDGFNNAIQRGLPNPQMGAFQRTTNNINNDTNPTAQENEDMALFLRLRNHFPRASLLQLNDIYYQVQREMFGHQ